MNRTTGARVRPPRQLALRVCSILGLVLLITGCATHDDPRKGGFVSGVVGLSSGRYEERITEREKTHADQLARQQRLAGEADDLARERATLNRDLDRTRIRLTALEQELDRARARLARESLSPVQRNRLEAAERRAQTMQGEVSKAQRSDLTVEDLRRQSRAIDRELEELDSMVDIISGG